MYVYIYRLRYRWPESLWTCRYRFVCGSWREKQKSSCATVVLVCRVVGRSERVSDTPHGLLFIYTINPP